MSKPMFIGLGAALFGVLFGINLWVNRPKIEKDLSARTRQALEDKAFSIQGTRFFGRDGYVVVEDQDPYQTKKAASIANEVFGVRTARVISSANTPPSVSIQRIGENIRLAGTLPNETTRTAFSDAAKDFFQGMSIEENFEIHSSVTAPPYLHSLSPLMGLLAKVGPEGRLELSGMKVSFSGEVPNDVRRQELIKQANELCPRTLTLTVTLTVANKQPASMSEEAVPSPDFKSELESTRLHFQFDSVKLTERNSYLVESLVELIKDHPQVRLRIVGHTDSKGSKKYNLRLSERRSEAIASLLESHGIARSSLSTEGHGELEPVSENQTPNGQADNRRVEFRLEEKS